MSTLKCETNSRTPCSEETAASWFVGLAPPAQTPSFSALGLPGQAAYLGSSSGPSIPLAEFFDSSLSNVFPPLADFSLPFNRSMGDLLGQASPLLYLARTTPA